MKKKHYNIPIFVPHIGCPHDCVFCNQRHITGVQSDVTPDSVRRIIEEHLTYIDTQSSEVEVAFFGGSFTGIDFSLQTALMEAAYAYIESGKVHSLRCSTRPDCIDGKILDNLKKYGMKTIELGVQSTDGDVLLKSGRGHGREEVFGASEMIKANGFSLGLQMMLGLPGDSREKSVATADDIIAIKPDFVRIYPTLVIEDTALWDMYKNGKYIPLELEYAVDLSAELTEKFENEGIAVIRIGLQTTESINGETTVGPYHSAMGELARGRIYRNKIERYILENNITDRLTWYVTKSDVSKAIGQNRCNAEYFQSKYGIDLKVLAKG